MEYSIMSKEDVIKILQEKGQKSNRVIRRLDFDDKFVKRCQELFGSWKDAVTIAGVRFIRQEYSKEELYDIIKNFIINNRSFFSVFKASFLDVQDFIFSVEKYYGDFDLLVNEVMQDEEILKEFQKYKNGIRDKVRHMIDIENESPAQDNILSKLKMNKAYIFKLFDCNTWIDFLVYGIGYTFEELISKYSYSNGKLIEDTKEELAQKYIELCSRIGKTATKSDINNDKESYSYKIYIRLFGGMKGLKQYIGIDFVEPNLKYSKEKIMNELAFLYRLNNYNIPTEMDLQNNKSIPVKDTILKYFKTNSIGNVWIEVKKSVNMEDTKLFNKDVTTKFDWNEAQDDFLKKYYHDHWNRDIAKCLKKDKKAIERRASKFKLHKDVEYISRKREVNSENIKTLREQGYTVPDICKILKISPATFYRNVGDIAKPYKNVSTKIPISREQILELKNNGYSLKNICETLNISVATYYRRLKEE